MNEHARWGVDRVLNRIGDIVRGEHPARVSVPAEELRRDGTGVHDTHLHTLVTHLEHQRFAEAHDRVLGSAVAATAHERAATGDRSDDHNVTPSALDHARQHRPRDVEERIEVHVDHRVPFVGRELEERLQIADAGVVYQNIRADAAERRRNRVGLRDIQLERVARPTARLNVIGQGVELGARTRRGHDVVRCREP